MPRSFPFALALGALASAWLAASSARADEADNPPKPRPTAPDTRAGRPTLALHLGYGTLTGSAEAGVAQGDFASWGFAPGGQLAYPFTRHFALELWGSRGSFTGGTDVCPRCSATSFAVGVGAVYHLVDGVPFDPWFSAGIGYRSTEFVFSGATATVGGGSTGGTRSVSATYGGVEALRFAIGSDYYPARYIGLGPFLEYAAGVYLNRDPALTSQGFDYRIHNAITVGMRVVFSPF